MNQKWEKESALVLKAVSSAATLFEGHHVNAIAFKTKESNRDVVTELDLIIEKHLRSELSHSGHPIVGEETATNEDLVRLMEKPVWVVDPIDGTANFIAGIPLYCVSAGLIADREFVAGAVILPALKEIFFISGEIAYMNGKVLNVDSCDLKDALIGMAFSGYAGEKGKRKKEYETFGLLNDISRGCLRTGSAAINICFVAAGRLNAALGIANKIWDVAGAMALASAAGCIIYMNWIKDSPCVNYLVGSPDIAEEMKSLLNKQGLADLMPLNSK